MAELACDIEDCKGLRTHLLWCKEHYAQAASGCGNSPSATCTIPGCSKPHSARGWCNAHYYRWKCSGDPVIQPRSYSCARCGLECVAESPRGRLPKYCAKCRRDALREMRRTWEEVQGVSRDSRSVPCAGCGKLIHGGKGALPPGERRCLDCRRATWTRTCGACEMVFCSKTNNTFCSIRCATSARVMDPLAFRPRPCVGCDAEVRGPGSVAVCSKCRPERRREQRRAKDRRRRAALYAATSEPYTQAEIAERDGYRCQLCGEAVAMGELVPHPKAPTIDHIVPLVSGGDDTRANIWLAHFLCNVRKGTRPLSEVLARL
jgi:hypothetical protein